MLVWSELCQLRRTKLHHGLWNTDINRLMHISGFAQCSNAPIHSGVNKGNKMQKYSTSLIGFFLLNPAGDGEGKIGMKKFSSNPFSDLTKVFLRSTRVTFRSYPITNNFVSHPNYFLRKFTKALHNPRLLLLRHWKGFAITV